MNVAYILNTLRAASSKLSQMLLPELEANDHGAEVLGSFFFDDNVYALRWGDPVGSA